MVEHFDAFLKIEDAGFVMEKTTLLWTGPYFLMLHTLKHLIFVSHFPCIVSLNGRYTESYGRICRKKVMMILVHGSEIPAW